MTTQHSHTPGLWTRNAMLGGGLGTLIVSDHARHSYVASVNYAGSVDETQANARLIAEAPAMLEALEAALMKHGRNARRALSADEYVYEPCECAVCTQARAVIARVKGQS